ncbi:hypothetical protein [Streptomyces zaomyceticus]|uniref:hypothetical protein n=1 Tax=Streptomyces zaomyceticus TaxID=68286 RepID=UPI00341730BD
MDREGGGVVVDTGLQVRFWDIRERPKRRKPFEVRWTVNGRERSESFIAKGLAESRRAKLMTAARDGEAFDEQTGLPASEIRAISQRTTWYDLAHASIDERGDRTPGNARRTLDGALATITPALVRREARYSEPRVLRRALYSWAFDKRAWESEPSAEWQHALDWMQRHSLPVSELMEPDVVRRALDALGRKIDGESAAAKTALRKRSAFSEVLGAAVDKGKVLTPHEQPTLLAKRPYDLRRAGISFWLHSGVDPAECARRAGQSIHVLFRYHAKFLDGLQEHSNRLIEELMQEWSRRSEDSSPTG